MLVSDYGLGFDNLMHFYDLAYNENELAMTQIAKKHFAPIPIYVAQANQQLLNHFKAHAYHGITATCSGFYGPQGRKIRGKMRIENLLDEMRDFQYQDLRITNFEMETSAIYGLGAMLGHNTATVCAIVANRYTKTFSSDYKATVVRLIELILERICD